MSSKRSWKFFRAGGFEQVRLETGADLLALDQLDQKLWVALACPTQGLEIDARTLELIDTDKDGRIRAPEILAAVKWTGTSLKHLDGLVKRSPTLPLSDINDATPEGRQLLASARQILTNLGKSDAPTISVEDTSDTVKIFSQTRFNGDGVVPAEAADSDSVKSILLDIIACLGPETDRSGKPGVNQAKADLFFAEAQAYSDWWRQRESDARIEPLGGATDAAAAAVKAARQKVDDYFTRCRLAAFDGRTTTVLNRPELDYTALSQRDLSAAATEVAGFPLSRIEPDRALPLDQALNPAWASTIARLKSDAITPLLGDRATLTLAEWNALTEKLAAYDAWLAAKAGLLVEKLGLPRVREVLAGGGREAVAALIAKDRELEPEANAIAAVDRLVHYHRDLHQLLNNFVSFSDFYRRKDKAIFQAGTLLLDQRSCDLCLPVDDAGRHSAMAGLAGAYLAYCDCVRKATGEKRQILAAFTAGDSDNLMIGRNGLFYDRKGRDWDATITKIIDNPISLRQAFWSPYKKLVRFVEEQVAKRAAAADAAINQHLSQAAQASLEADKAKAGELAKTKIDTGTLAAIGLVLTTLLSALSVLFGHIMGLPPWQVPLALVALVLAVSAPAVIMAWLKLRKRNLGPILDANGWAVNARAKINVPLGRSLTQVAVMPPGAQRELVDPFAEKTTARNWLIFLLVAALAAGIAGYLLRDKPPAKPDLEKPAAPAAATNAAPAAK